MKVVIFFVSLLYIILEIALRVRFLDIAGVSTSNIKIIETVEVIGRAIASLGFSILISSFLHSKIKEKKVLKSISFSVIAFIAFFFSQKYIIEFSTKNVSGKIKERAFYLEIKKNNFYNINDVFRDNNKQVFFNLDGEMDVKDRVFYINYPLSYYHLNENTNPTLDDVKSQIDIYVDFNFKNNKYYYYEIIIDVNLKFKKIHDEYLLLSDFLDSQFKGKKYEKDLTDLKNKILFKIKYDFGAYKDKVKSSTNHYDSFTMKTTSERFSNYNEYFINSFSKSTYLKNALKDDYGRYKRNILKSKYNIIDIKSEISEYFKHNAINNNLGLIALRISNEELYDKFIIDIENISDSLCINLSQSELKGITGFDFGKNGTIYIKSDLENHIIIDTENESQDNLYCDSSNSINKIKRVLSLLSLTVNKDLYGVSSTIDNKTNFFRTPYYQKEFKNHLRSLRVYVDGFMNINDPKLFDNIYKQIVYGKAEDQVNVFLNQVLGEKVYSFKNKSKLKFGLSFDEFVKSKLLNSYIKENFPFMFTDSKSHFYFSDYEIAYDDAMERYAETPIENLKASSKEGLIILYKEMKNGKFNDERLDNFVKAIVVPIFVLLISTIMIALNIINLMLIFINKEKVRNLIKYSLFAIFLIMPLFINNKYDLENKELYRNINNKNFTNWLQNINLVINPIEEVFEDSVIIIDYMEYHYLDIFEDFGDERVVVRKKELKKTLK